MDPTGSIGNFENSGGSQVLQRVKRDLLRAIAYYLSEDHRTEVMMMYLDELLAAVDMLAIMSEYYKISPEVRQSTVRRWRDTYLSLFDMAFNPKLGGAKPDWVGKRRAVILDTFQRLDSIAVLRPPFPLDEEVE